MIMHKHHKVIVLILLLCISLLFSSCGENAPRPETKQTDEISSVFFFSTRRIYDAAANVYTGTLIQAEPVGELVSPHTANHFRCTVQVETVLKGDLQPGDTVYENTGGSAVSREMAAYLDPERKDEYSGMLEKGDRYMFMSGNDPEFYFCGKEYETYFSSVDPDYSRITADKILPPEYCHIIHLLDDGRVDTGKKWNSGGTFEGGIKPPATYEELMEQLRTPSPTLAVPTGSETAPSYACPCEFPDEMIRQGLEALSDPYREPAAVRKAFYCEKHDLDNLKRFEN